LAVLVAEHRFDYKRPSHRRALLEDDELGVGPEDPRAEELVRLQTVYREVLRQGSRMDAEELVVGFGRVANWGRGR
jgi:hypothetical protein